MTSLFSLYSAAYARRPMATQCATSAVIFGTGDVIAQQVVARRGARNHDFTRTARFILYGAPTSSSFLDSPTTSIFPHLIIIASLFGPFITKWHQFINRRQFTSPVRAVVYKVTLDQLLAAPLITVPMFFGSMSILEGHPEEAIPRIKNAYSSTLARGWCLFIPAQIINFAFVPISMRVLFISCAGLCWNTYLSFFNAKQKQLQEQPENIPP